MHNPFDQLAKKVGKEALDASGPTVVQYEISRDAQHADLRHDPDPARGAERARLGLLGRLAEVPCLIEIFGHAPGGAEVRACIGKHFAHWEEHAARARARNRKRKEKGLAAEPLAPPRLWILAPTVSASMLREMAAEAAVGWPPGVHFVGGGVLGVGIVAASELPRGRATVLVRIMAAGHGLPEALADLAALPEDAHERAVTEEILLRLEHQLARKPNRTTEEEEFVVTIQSTWKEATALGRAQGEARALLTALRARGIPVPEVARERILAERDLDRLDRWVERAVVAASLDEVLGLQG